MIVNQVACGHRHTLLDTDAGLCAFGANEAGQLGVGSSATRVNTPRYVISGQIPEVRALTRGACMQSLANRCVLYSWIVIRSQLDINRHLPGWYKRGQYMCRLA